MEMKRVKGETPLKIFMKHMFITFNPLEVPSYYPMHNRKLDYMVEFAYLMKSPD